MWPAMFIEEETILTLMKDPCQGQWGTLKCMKASFRLCLHDNYLDYNYSSVGDVLNTSQSVYIHRLAFPKCKNLIDITDKLRWQTLI